MGALTDIISANSFASTLDFPFGFATNMVGTATGNAAISGGALVLNGSGYQCIDYTDTVGMIPLGDQFQMDVDYEPQYSGTPAARQNLFYTSQASGLGNNQLYCYHSAANGNLELYVANHVNAQMIYVQAPFNPVAGTRYKLCFFYDLRTRTAGVAGIYIGTSRGGYATGINYTRLPLMTFWRIGGDGSNTAGHVGNFKMRNLWFRGTVQDTGATRVEPTFPAVTLATQAVPNENQVELDVDYNYGLSTGSVPSGVTNVMVDHVLEADSLTGELSEVQ